MNDTNIDAVAVLREALNTCRHEGNRKVYEAANVGIDALIRLATDSAATVAKDGGERQQTPNPFPEGSPNENWRRGYEGVRHFGARDSLAARHWKMGRAARLADDKANATPKPEASAATQQAGEWTEKLDRWWLNADGVSDTFVRLSDVERLFAKPIEKESTADDAGLRVIKFIEKLDKRLVAEGYALECRRAVVNAIMEIGQVAVPISEDTAKAECGACNGSGWVPRDADIGTEQECFSCDGSGLAEEEAPAAPGSIGNAQAVEIAARIFGFKPHKQTEEDKAMWIELSNAYVLADRAARAGKGSIGDDPKFYALLTALTGWHITPNSVPGAIEKRIAAREAFITYVDSIIQGTRNEQ